VAGNQLVDGNGHEVRLLGVNRSGAEYACVQGHAPLAGPSGRRAIAAMTAWRINAVRVPLNEHCWLGINGSPAGYSRAHYRAAIKRYVARLHRAGLYVVLDLHWNAPGGKPAHGQQPMADLDHAPAFWTSVARVFRHDHAIAFDLYNEPHDISWKCWRDGCAMPEGWRSAGMQTLVSAVRSTGALQPIIATGIDWGSDLTSWLAHKPRDPRNQLAAGLHVFDFSHCTSAPCWKRTFGPVARSVPVVATELGQRQCGAAFMDRFMNWADAAGVSYLGWSWNPFGCGGPALIESWSGQPTGPGRQLRARLLALDARRLQ
jgi:endoglucanase